MSAVLGSCSSVTLPRRNNIVALQPPVIVELAAPPEAFPPSRTLHGLLCAEVRLPVAQDLAALPVTGTLAHLRMYGHTTGGSGVVCPLYASVGCRGRQVGNPFAFRNLPRKHRPHLHVIPYRVGLVRQEDMRKFMSSMTLCVGRQPLQWELLLCEQETQRLAIKFRLRLHQAVRHRIRF